MSEADIPPAPPGPPPVAPPPPRSGWMTAFMILVGIILLLPGVCALGFGAMSLTNSRTDPTVTMFVVVGLLIGFGGVMLIRAAIRGHRRARAIEKDL
jgi:hypothetical protein